MTPILFNPRMGEYLCK